jgi:hypothetical protein
LALFVAHCLRSDNPFVDPALFRIPDFTRATLVMTPFSIAFGATSTTPNWRAEIWTIQSFDNSGVHSRLPVKKQSKLDDVYAGAVRLPS